MLCTATLACHVNSALADDVSTSAAKSLKSVSSPVSISSERILDHIAFLAHDELEGRGTGQDGIDLAAGYIAGQFAVAGLKPGGPNGTFFQRFTIPDDPTLTEETRFLAEGSSGTRIEPKLRADFTALSLSAEGDFDAPACFVGYGCINPDKSYDDYAGINVTGKVVLMLRREPPGWGAEAGEFSTHARFETKVRLAKDKGAVAVVIANQKPTDEGVDVLMPFGRSRGTEGIPAIHVKRDVMNQLLATGGLQMLDALQDVLDKSGSNVSADLSGIKVSGKIVIEGKELIARNVIGILPSAGRQSDEYIVIGGHYDHLGVRRGRIYNGADDNASGTAAVIELAHTLSKIPRRDRCILFMAFSGEEIGLEGSRYFTKNPTVRIDSIRAMINMDMIGRLDSSTDANMLAIQGLGTGSSFKEIVARATDAISLRYIPDDSAIGPSDHDAFYRAGIPSLFFFTGEHSDYHQPGDDIEKVNAAGCAQIAGLVGRIALDLLNGQEAPKYVEVTEPAKLFRSSAGGGVVMGILPDMDDESGKKGWRVGQVIPNGGAAKAGMKSGDRIIHIDGLAISGMSDYRDATKEKKPGDTITVVVLRDEQEIALNVELAARTR
jgi:Zn-dependent M28 family amino/carboxypeptidase